MISKDIFQKYLDLQSTVSKFDMSFVALKASD